MVNIDAETIMEYKKELEFLVNKLEDYKFKTAHCSIWTLEDEEYYDNIKRKLGLSDK